MPSYYSTAYCLLAHILMIAEDAIGRCTGTPHSCISDHYSGNQIECIRHGCSYFDHGVFGLGSCSGIPTSCNRLREMGKSCEWHGCHTVGLDGYGSQSMIENELYSNAGSGSKSSEGLSTGAIVGIAFAATLIVLLFTIVLPLWMRRHEHLISRQTETSKNDELSKRDKSSNFCP